MQYSGIVFCGHLCYSIIARRAERGIKNENISSIDNNTKVIIKDKNSGTLVCGLWYQDKILVWGNFVEYRNIAILQLL